MKKIALSSLGAAVLLLVVAAWLPTFSRLAQAAEVATAEEFQPQTIIRNTCLRCHSGPDAKGELVLSNFNVALAADNPEIAEKIVRKLRAGLMPPPGEPRPSDAALNAVAEDLERRLDAAAAEYPNPGRRPFQRLNRAEYSRAVRDLLSIDVDVEEFLPADTISAGFDNIADVQNFSATLLEGYLRAADKISRLAVGDPNAGPSDKTYKVPRTASQLGHVEGAPFGTRGGVSVDHIFPADGEYVFKIMLHSGPTGFLYGMTSQGEKLEVSVDGERKAVLEVHTGMHEQNPEGMLMQTPPIRVKAGARRLSAAFLKKQEGPFEDLLSPLNHTLADTMIGGAYGVTTVPHLRDLIVSGPFEVTGVSNTPSRKKIFTKRPTSAEDELPTARSIVASLAESAYRRPLSERDLEGLMGFYEAGRAPGDFEGGIRMALQAILASPHFIFRLEQPAEEVEPGEIFRIRDVDLASRLSFFLWASLPDAELVALAREDRLSDPETFEKQVRRMLADPRAEALATRFASLWLRLQDLEKVHPDALTYPQFDRTMGEAMRRETELFFEHVVREDRSLLDLLTADYTYLNEYLASYYGIPGVAGKEFRKVTLTDENRRGLLGHGSILTQTSHANRTAPVLRGKWVMEVLLGNPPPPPPPDVPDLEETEAVEDGRLLTVRERLEEHRDNPACHSCHQIIDPIGLALENFDVTGRWRVKDSGAPVDPTSEMYDGTPLTGPADLRNALMARSDVFVRTFIEYMMSYALGRRLEHFDMPAVRAIARRAAEDEYRIGSVILGVVNSDAFRMSRVESEETGARALNRTRELNREGDDR